MRKSRLSWYKQTKLIAARMLLIYISSHKLAISQLSVISCYAISYSLGDEWRA